MAAIAMPIAMNLLGGEVISGSSFDDVLEILNGCLNCHLLLCW
jgi:hypothetical protein